MTKASRKRKQRRENAVVDQERLSGKFRVFHKKNRRYETPPLPFKEAVKIWQECDHCIILEAR